MIDRLKVWVSSKSWFWKIKTWIGKIGIFFERSAFKTSASETEAKLSIRILSAIAWIGLKSLFGVGLFFLAVNLVEINSMAYMSWPSQLSEDNKAYIVEQLRLYAQLLTAIFSIYFATIGIILSAGYTRLRRDIIQMLTNEQVGSVYSKLLVFAAIFCLVSTGLPIFGFEPGLFIYAAGTILTLLSTLALFPLGQRLFNFFDLNQLVRSEILPSIARHIEGAASNQNSIYLANHHSRSARLALEQLSYIDDRVKSDKFGLKDNLPALSNDYSNLLMHYLQQKHKINEDSYWFPRRSKHKQWFLAGDSATSMALQMSSQQMLIEEKPDHQWFENKVIERLTGHIELACEIGDFDLALILISGLSTRISAYAMLFHFEQGLLELKRIKIIIEQVFESSSDISNAETVMLKIGIADTWAALGSNLCLETLRRMITFEKELNHFFAADDWSETSLRSLPAFLQVELAFIVERIEFERKVEGERLSKSKYIQQLAVQKLLQQYSKVLPAVCDFYQKMVPDFVGKMVKLKMSEAATQVVLASLHSHWKLPRWIDEIDQLVGRYQDYLHYTEKPYTLPQINFSEITKQLAEARDDAISMLGRSDLVRHIFEKRQNEDLPDHFGQIYFELAEACISALEHNDEIRLGKVIPMFLSLAFMASDSRFTDPSLEVNDEFRLHLISTVINDLASVLGYAILYGAYFDNEKLSESALAQFDAWIEGATNKHQYLKRMVLLSNRYSFSFSAAPREMIRIKWKMSFEELARNDGFGDQFEMMRGKIHPNNIVREFLRSYSDASHLFFAQKIVPQLELIDFEIDHHITSLVRQLTKDEEDQDVDC